MTVTVRFRNHTATVDRVEVTQVAPASLDAINIDDF